MNTRYNETIHNNYDNDWGFYVDIETLNPVLTDEKYYNRKKYNDYHNNLYDEYSNDIKDDIPYSNDIRDENLNSDPLKAFIVRASSTTIITAAITYFVFFIL